MISAPIGSTLDLEPQVEQHAELDVELPIRTPVVPEDAPVQASAANGNENTEFGLEGTVAQVDVESLVAVESTSSAASLMSTALLESVEQLEGVECAADMPNTKAIVCTQKTDLEMLPPCGTVAQSKSLVSTSTVDTVIPQAKASGETEHEREEFSGLRIVKRCIPAAQWSQEIRGKNRRIVPFSRFSTELAYRRRDYDCVVIGVLYECINSDKFANGEVFARWGLTDLAEPKPRRLVLHLRYQAFTHWRTRANSASACRGSIFAIMNPVLVDQSVGRAGDTETIARIEKASQLLKLGECPSLGKCAEGHCNLPCNARSGNRFCELHLGNAYADKPGRIAACGGANISTASLLRGRQNVKPKSRTYSVVEPEEDENDKSNNVENAKKIKTQLAMQLDERRSNHSDAKEDYLRSICRGTRPDSNNTSRVPILARGLEGPDTIELDFATIASSEKLKAERMLEQRAERKTSLSDAVEAARFKAKLATKRNEAVRKRSLGELVEALNSKRTTRRVGVIEGGGHGSSIVSTADEIDTVNKVERPSTASSSGANVSHSKLGHSFAPPTVPSPQGLVPLPIIPISDSIAHAQKLLSDLAVAGNDTVRIKAILQEVDNLPGAVLCENVGRMLYAAIGCLTQHSDHGDIKRLALSTRRRLRAASDKAAQETNKAAAPALAKSDSTHEEANIGTAIVSMPSVESKLLNNGVTYDEITSQCVADSGEFPASNDAIHKKPEDETADDVAVDDTAIEKKQVATDSC